MDHAATVRRFYDLINAGEIDGFGALLAADFVEHEELARPRADEGGRHGVLPDVRGRRSPTCAWMCRTSSRAATRSSSRARHGDPPGRFMGMPATGKSIDAQLIDIMGMGADGLCTSTGASWTS